MGNCLKRISSSITNPSKDQHNFEPINNELSFPIELHPLEDTSFHSFDVNVAIETSKSQNDQIKHMDISHSDNNILMNNNCENNINVKIYDEHIGGISSNETDDKESENIIKSGENDKNKNNQDLSKNEEGNKNEEIKINDQNIEKCYFF